MFQPDRRWRSLDYFSCSTLGRFRVHWLDSSNHIIKDLGQYCDCMARYDMVLPATTWITRVNHVNHLKKAIDLLLPLTQWLQALLATPHLEPHLHVGRSSPA